MIKIIEDGILQAAPRLIELAGTVTDPSNNPLARTIIVYRNKSNTAIEASTVSSAADGTFSLQVNGNSKDEFRLVVIGEEGENSSIFESIKE